MRSTILVLFATLLTIATPTIAQWQSSSTGLHVSGNDTLSVYAFADLDTLIFAATSHGVFSSGDKGHTWHGQHWGQRGGLRRDISDADYRDIIVLRHEYTLKHPKWLWVRQAFDRIWTDSLAGQAITVDPNGCAIVAATLAGTAYFNEDSVSGGPSSIVVLKYDPSGNLLWMRTAKTPQFNAYYTSIACDSFGNIFAAGICGWIGRTATIDFGTKQITSSGESSPFLASYDGDGNFRWAVSGTTSGGVSNVWVAADAGGVSYLYGEFSRDLTFGKKKLSALTHIRGFEDTLWEEDIFLARFGFTGSNMWAVQSSSKNHVADYADYGPNATPQGLCVDPRGNCYVLGWTTDTQFVANVMMTGSAQQFVAKYDRNGNGKWLTRFVHDPEAQYTTPFTSLSCDANGNIAICGVSEEEFLTINGTRYETYGMYDYVSPLLVSLDSSGATRWFKRSGANTQLYATPRHLAVSGAGDIFIDMDVDPGGQLSFDSVRIDSNVSTTNRGLVRMHSDGKTVWAFADGETGLLAPCRDQSLYALHSSAMIDAPDKPYRYGRIGFMSSFAVAKLSASAPGLTIDTDIYASSVGGFGNIGTMISADRGHGWFGAAFDGRPGYPAYQFATIGTTIFEATESGVYRSSDFGESWDKVFNTSIKYLHASGTTLNAFALDNDYTSTDLGKTWKPSDCQRNARGMMISVGQRLFAEGGSMSEDSGKTWSRTNVGLGGYAFATVPERDDDSKALGAIGTLLLDGSSGLCASSNLGETWTSARLNVPVRSIHQYGDEVLVGAQSAGVWRRSIAEIQTLVQPVPPVFSWANQLHASDNAAADALAADANSNVVVLGSYRKSVQNESTTHSRNQSGKTDRDYFIAKYNSSGGLIWSAPVHGGGVEDTAMHVSIAVSSSGDIYTSGNFFDTLSVGSLTLIGSHTAPTIFLLKSDGSGQVQWLKAITSAQLGTYLSQMVLDRTGRIVITGAAATKAEVGGISLSDDQNQTGAFIASFGSDGNAVWAKRVLANKAQSFANALTVSSDNEYYVGGRYQDGFPKQATGLFLSRYDASGALNDTLFAGAVAADAILTLSADDAGNVYVGGSYADTLTLRGMKLSPARGDARFLATFTGSKCNWAKATGYPARLNFKIPIPTPYRIATDPAGNTFVTGLDSIFGQTKGERQQGLNYITKYDASGERDWSKQLPNGSMFSVLDIATNASSAVWSAGAILNTNALPSYSNDCKDISFGLYGFSLTPFDSNYSRPFVAQLANTAGRLAVVHRSAQLSKKMMFGVYPNPSTGSVTISYELEQPQVLHATLCDLLGHTVTTLLDGEMESGHVERTATLDHLPDGTYYMRIESSDGVTTVPLILQKH